MTALELIDHVAPLSAEYSTSNEVTALFESDGVDQLIVACVSPAVALKSVGELGPSFGG
jgi:hypothetical protein